MELGSPDLPEDEALSDLQQQRADAQLRVNRLLARGETLLGDARRTLAELDAAIAGNGVALSDDEGNGVVLRDDPVD